MFLVSNIHAQLTIQGKDENASNQMVRLCLSGITVQSAAWDIIYYNDISYIVDSEVINSTGTAVVFCGPNGNYRISAWAISDGKMVHAIKNITIGKKSPIDPVKPIKPTGRLWVTAIYDLDKLATISQAQRSLRVSTTIQKELSNFKCYWKTYDCFSEDVKSWSTTINSVGVPALLVIDENSKILWSGPLPQDENSIIEIVKGIR